MSKRTALTYLRWATQRDLVPVLAIEQASYVNSLWTIDHFRQVLRQRDCIMFVAERGDVVVGFAVYQLHPDRIEVLNLAVAPAARRTGIGRALVEKLIYKTGSHNRNRLVLNVHETNAAALACFHAAGLRARKLVRGAYGEADGVRMEWWAPDDAWFTGAQPQNRLERYPI